MDKTIVESVQRDVLIKFLKKERAEDLLDGKLSMATLKKYREYEDERGNTVIGDECEGKITVSEVVLKITDTKTGQVQEEKIDSAAFETEYANSYIFCMLSVGKKGEREFVFSEEQKKEIKEFGDRAVVITDFDEFKNRIAKAAKKAGHEVVMKYVGYEEEGTVRIDKWVSLMHDMRNIVFWKRGSYKYQQEFRVLLVNKNAGKERITLDIGNIRDIAKEVEAKKVLSAKVICREGENKDNNIDYK